VEVVIGKLASFRCGRPLASPPLRSLDGPAYQVNPAVRGWRSILRGVIDPSDLPLVSGPTIATAMTAAIAAAPMSR
jgi:hypothetical protein